MSRLQQLQAWVERQCDGDWEHQSGVEITTLDNPGWSVSIDLASTPHAQTLQETKIERSPGDWIHCRRLGDKFVGYGGVRNLEEILAVFLDWVGVEPGEQGRA